MGRPPSNGGPSFRFTQAEGIAEMEAILQAHKTAMPERQVLVSLAEKFSKSEERAGKIEVQMKQVWNWFQNRRYAIRAKAAKAPGNLNATQMVHDSSMVKGVPQVTQVTQPHAAAAAASVNVRSFPQAPQHPTVPSASVRTFPQAPQQPPAFSVQSVGRVADNSQMEFEAKSARDGAWYDVSTFISHRSLETGDPEVFVRFAGFGAEEDEWVNVRKNVRQRSLPCEASECVAVLPADLILCFQEGKEQALYFDAHVLDAQRRRHDVRGCRCRFLVRYDHDQSEEIVALRKICRRPETDYRLQQLHAVNESIAANQNKNGANNNNHTVSTLRVYPPAEVQPKQHKVEPVAVPSPSPPEAPQKRQRLDSTVAPEGSQPQFKAESVVANVPQNQQTVQPAVPVVPARSDEVPVVPARSDEVPVKLQKVQPLTSDPIIEVEPRNVAADVPSLSEPKQELRAEEQISEAVGPVIPPSAGALLEEKTELAEPQKEPVVSDASVEVPAELLDVQPDVRDQPHTSALETKSEDPVLFVSVNEPHVVEEVIETKTEDVVPVSSGDPNVVQETKTEEAAVLVSGNNAKTYEAVVPIESNVVQETKTEEAAVLVSSNDPNVAQESTTEEPVVPVESNVAQEATTEEPVVPDESNVAQEATTEQPVVPDDSNLATTTEESVMLVDSNVAQEATTEEPMVPVDSNVVHEATTKEPVVPVDTNVAQEAKTEEPVVPVDPNVVQEAKTEEPVVPVDPNVVQEAKTEEPVVPVNDPTGIETEIEQPIVSEMEIDEEKAGDNKVENMDVTQENAAVAMEEG
ncbi:putative transcription factor homeobox-WOX family [Helianthus annuus]|nr:putative transcription factor homeobox-WOX family [Helianthus annuus]